MARVKLPESKLRARRRRRRWAAAALWVVLILLFVGGVVGLTHLPHLRVVAVEAEGVEGTEAALVRQEVFEHLAGRYFYLVPRDNIILYPHADIVAGLLKQFPTFATVEVKAKTLRSLNIVVTKRSPEALWCGAARATPTPCFILDEQGVAYEAAADFGGAVYTIYYGELAKSALPRQFITEETSRALMALTEAFEEQQDMRVVSVEVDSVNDVYLHFVNGFELIFALGNSGGDIYERFVLALTAEPFVEHSITDFEYLDLRFGDRLYYKLKGE